MRNVTSEFVTSCHGQTKERVTPQRKVLTTPLLTEANKRRNTQFTKKNLRCQRGGVRGAANQIMSPDRATLQTKRCSNDEAAALRKYHGMRPAMGV